MSEILGVLPCAGNQIRMRELVFAKELLPLFDGRPVVAHSIDALRLVTPHIVAIVNPKKKDLIAYLKRRRIEVIVETSEGLPSSIARCALSYHQPTLFCLPDTYYRPKNVFVQLVKHPAKNLLGLFESGTPERFDSVYLKGDCIVHYAVKTNPPLSPWTMGCGKLSPETLNYLRRPAANHVETVFGDCIMPLVQLKKIFGLKLKHSRYYDLGTPSHYIEYLIKRFAPQPTSLIQNL